MHLRVFSLVLIVLTLIQIAFGTLVRGAVDAALDAGTARDGALATVGMIDHLHRDTAIAVLFGALLLTWWLFNLSPEPGLPRARSRGARSPQLPWCYAVVTLAVLQVAIGVAMAYGSLLPAAQVLHLTIASLLLGAETVLLLLSGRQTA